jgi:hypothetical protein
MSRAEPFRTPSKGYPYFFGVNSLFIRFLFCKTLKQKVLHELIRKICTGKTLKKRRFLGQNEAKNEPEANLHFRRLQRASDAPHEPQLTCPCPLFARDPLIRENTLQRGWFRGAAMVEPQ